MLILFTWLAMAVLSQLIWNSKALMATLVVLLAITAYHQMKRDK